MKKGFTLIELLAIITVIGIMTLIMVPSITKTLKNSDDKQYQQFLNNLYMATETYVQLNRDEFENFSVVGDTIDINIGKLVNSQLLTDLAVNPKTKVPLTTNDVVKVTIKSDKTLDFELVE